jgi:hypothetical protein
MLVNGKSNANIVHYANMSCTRGTRSVLAAELYALVLGFDHSILVCEIFTEILERAVPIDGMIDSQTLYEIVARLSSPPEKRLGIDIYSLQESHRLGELRSLYRIPSVDNVYDPLTKATFELNCALRRLMSQTYFALISRPGAHAFARTSTEVMLFAKPVPVSVGQAGNHRSS